MDYERCDTWDDLSSFNTAPLECMAVEVGETWDELPPSYAGVAGEIGEVSYIRQEKINLTVEFLDMYISRLDAVSKVTLDACRNFALCCKYQDVQRSEIAAVIDSFIVTKQKMDQFVVFMQCATKLLKVDDGGSFKEYEQVFGPVELD
jgi:hypothetical protein